MIHPTAHIDCPDLQLGEGTVIRAHAELYGTKIHLGRDCFIDEYSVVGGGSAFDPDAELIAGDFLMTGMFSQINIGRPVHIGDEFGLGIGAKVFTHEAWLSEYDGFPCKFAPVTIGDRVWVPDGIIRPGSVIGDDVVIGAGSVVSGEIPSGSFAAGVPAKVLRGNYPDRHPEPLDVLTRIVVAARVGKVTSECTIACDDAVFDVAARTIVGPVTEESERLRHQLRRHGIRFRYTHDGEYRPW